MKTIGTDESGKGDYFGYLVIAGVAIDSESEKKLLEIGVCDSKRISDSAIHKLNARIRKLCDYEIVRISPEKYNILHSKFGNLNKILAWGHAKVIEKLCERVKPDSIIIDKFADRSFIEKELEKKAINIKAVKIVVRGEENMAVAAASIIARNEFLRTLRMLGREIGVVLPKGASNVLPAADEVVRLHGKDMLDKVAKIHFKTTKNVGKE